MPKRRPPHDALFKAAFSEIENLIGELRALLAGALIDALDFSRAELLRGSFVDRALGACHSDLLWRVALRGREAYLYILLEHQSRPDPLMPFRLLVYLVRIWEKWLADHPGASRLPAIVPLVVYQGPGRWSAARRFTEVIDLEADALAGIAAYLPSFELLLDELSEQSTGERRRREVPAFGLALEACNLRLSIVPRVRSYSPAGRESRTVSNPRRFLCVPYASDERGVMLPSAEVDACPSRADSSIPCKLSIHGFRPLLTGPMYPLQVMHRELPRPPSSASRLEP